MKIRTGFVSNSSSSSFCIYGFYLEQDQIEQINKIVFDKEDKDKFYQMETSSPVYGYFLGSGDQSQILQIEFQWLEKAKKTFEKYFPLKKAYLLSGIVY